MALQSRPEPMNASPHHPKVKTSLKLGDALFVAGGIVAGKMEMECKADKGLGIGIIMVELFAIEELTSRDHSATSTFLHSRRVFQGPGLPPSNSVHPYPLPGEPPLPPNHYGARRGITTFLFRFPLPKSSPAAINFGSGLANVRYEIRASVGVSWKGERRLVTDRKEVDVVEGFREELVGEPEAVTVSENGKIWVQGRVIGGVLAAGQPACVELQVKNHSTKKNTGLSVSLTRVLHLPNVPPSEKTPLQISDTQTSVSFRGQEYIIQPGTEGVANLVFDVPENARGVKGGIREGDEEERRSTTSLFEVRCIVDIKLSMGFGSKDILLQIPVTVLHPAALPEIPVAGPYPLPPIQPYNIPSYDVQSQIPYPISQTPHVDLANHPYPPLPMSPPILPYVDQGQGWYPPPQIPVHYPYMSPPPDVQSYYLPPPPLMSPYVIPLRPSSAEPTPSHPLYNIPSGLPASAVQQPLIPLITGTPPNIAREEGKGERASRIAQHLRISSRHRSVSPQAHRYPLPTPSEVHLVAPPSAPTAIPDIHQRTSHQAVSPPSSPQAQLHIPLGRLSVSSGDVVSPRPMLSPKQSFAVDPLTNTTLSKSERVETLERLAAVAEKANSDMSTSVPDVRTLSAMDKHKTLPSPPVPSGKERAISAIEQLRPRADTLFTVPEPTEYADKTPPTPTLAAVTSLKVPRADDGGLSGLDALEARLLAEVGTRKVDQDDRRPDVRSVLPIPIPIKGQPPNDSAISSLTLPGLGDDGIMANLGKSSPVHSAGIHHDGEMTERGRTRERERDQGGSSDDLKKERRSQKKSGKKDKEYAGDEHVAEVNRLRKAAQGRVAAWLGSIDITTPPSSATPPSFSPERGTYVKDEAPKQEVVQAPSNQISSEIKQDQPSTDKEVNAQPNPRSSGFVPIGTLNRHTQRQKPNTDLTNAHEVKVSAASPCLIARPLDPEVRYDVHSARGGRGGKVTSVAAIWASAAQTQAQSPKKPSSAPPTPAKVPKPVTAFGKGNVLNKHPLPFVKSTPSPIKAPKHFQATPRTGTTPASVANLSSKRAKMIKSSSVPAIISSSLATPMLSSTASLARPSPAFGDRMKLNNKLSPIVSEVRATNGPKPDNNVIKPSTAAAGGEMAFGQARLRELIKRYQGQTNV